MRGKKGGRRDQNSREEKYRINGDIRAAEVRLIDDEGKMLGVMTSRDALKTAEDRGLDLIEIAPNAKPPTCKIMDYGKWKYENKKKQTAARKKQTIISIKEVQVRPRTEKHDLDVKMKHARKFLLEGDKVKINLRFVGREMAHQELGYELLEKLSKMLEDIAITETPPKKEGRQVFVLLAPDPVKIKDYLKDQEKKAKANGGPKAADVSKAESASKTADVKEEEARTAAE